MATPRKKTFRVNVGVPVSQEPAVLTDPTSWCWKLLANDGALLNAKVKHAAYPGIALNSYGTSNRQCLYAACVAHVIVEAVDQHRVSPTYTAIAKCLNESGVTTWSGNQWNRKAVHEHVRKAGLIRHIAANRHVNNMAFTTELANTPTLANGISIWPS